MRTGPHKSGRLRHSPLRAAAALALTTPACIAPIGSAQAQQTTQISTTIIDDLSIVKLEDLDFGNIAGAAAGTIQMTPTETATCSASTGLIHSQECQPATFAGKGDFNQRLRIRKPQRNRITITEPGGATMLITDMTIDADPDLRFIRNAGRNSIYRIDAASGLFTFRVGGTLNVSANQAPGEYTATFDIEINYN